MEARALEFLQCIYQNEQIALGVRMRAAIEALAFESPKLSATAIISEGEAFADRLQRAIIRSREKLIEHGQVIEHIPAEPVEVAEHIPAPNGHSPQGVTRRR